MILSSQQYEILRRLSRGPKRADSLRSLYAYSNGYRALKLLREGGLISRKKTLYYITEKGRNYLRNHV